MSPFMVPCLEERSVHANQSAYTPQNANLQRDLTCGSTLISDLTGIGAKASLAKDGRADFTFL